MIDFKKTNPVRFGYYCVALIDILNQREALQRFKELPRTEEERKEFIQIAKETFGVIDGIRNLFDSFYSSYAGYKVPPPSNDMMKTELKFQGFSDTIIIYVSLATNSEHIPINSIYATLLACGSTFLYSMAAGRPLRGGIEIGIGAEIYEGEIYGPALSEAYRLESEIAQYPRIVVGKELTAYLWGHKNFKEPDVHKEFAKAISELCLSLLTQDVDGYPIVDYLGEGFMRALKYGQPDVAAARLLWKIKKAYPLGIQKNNLALLRSQTEEGHAYAQKYRIFWTNGSPYRARSVDRSVAGEDPRDDLGIDRSRAERSSGCSAV